MDVLLQDLNGLSILDKYDLREMIGSYVMPLMTSHLPKRGGNSTVIKALNKETNEFVAIKVIRKAEIPETQVCDLIS